MPNFTRPLTIALNNEVAIISAQLRKFVSVGG